jgi:SAM-dependent methyltransferase
MKTSATYWDYVSQALQKKQPDRLWRRHSDAVDCRLLARWLPADDAGRLLKTDMYDESLGAGIRLPRRAGNWNAVGMDIAAEMLKAARRVGGYPFLVATDVRKLAFAENSFDAIFSNSTLDHFHSTDQIVASLVECHRILKPGGRFILTMDNPLNPVLKLRQALPHRWLVKLGITTFYYGCTLTPGALKRALERAGFKVLNIAPVLHCPRVLAIPAARFVERHAAPGTKQKFLKYLTRFEKLSSFPTRYLTGHYTAVCCQKEPAACERRVSESG